MPFCTAEASLFGLAVTETDAAVAVADHHQGSEGEPTSAFTTFETAIHP